MKQALKLIAQAKKNRKTRLDLGNCGLTELPDELFELTWLEELILSDSWSEYIYKNQARYIKVSENKGEANNIIFIHPNIKLIKGLKKLIVAGANNKELMIYELKDISSLKELTHLQQLNISNTQVNDLSPLKELTHLQQLHLDLTQVSDLSPLQHLTHLQQLYISSTQVSDISPLQNLTHLQQVNISSTQVSDLSPLQNLTYLQQVNVQRTLISDLNPLQCLAQLQNLYISATQVSDLSPLQNLTHLQQLSISETQVSDLSSLTNLSALQQLYVSSTQVSDLSPLTNLSALQQLYVSSTQVSDLSPLTNLLALQLLDVSSTQVSDLSPLTNLLALQQLKISGNQIQDRKDLEWIVKLENLKKLCILDTPALDNPLLFSKNSYSDNILEKVKTYLNSLTTDKPEIIYETKMILVGEGDVGKTSVRKKLVIGNDTFTAVPKKGISTEGFEIDTYQIEVDIKEKPQEVILNIWDLGGQDVQLPTHQFFMRHSALYLFVFDSRLNDEKNCFDKWLYLIQKLSNDPRNPSAVCPIIGVMNQFDAQTKLATADIWLHEYKGQLKNFITINCTKLNDEGIDNLEKEIAKQVLNIEGFGTIEMNKDWLAVRHELIQLTPQYRLMSMRKYKEVCLQKGVIKESEQDTLLNMLDRLGSLLWYEDKVAHLSSSENEKLKNIIFLDHQWSSQAIYQLLMDKKQLINHEASMGFDELKQYWKGDYWKHQEQLILLMKRFGFCFEAHDKKHFIFTPLLSPVKHIEADSFKEKIVNSGKKVLRLRLKYAEDVREDIMPRALTARLIAIRHKDIIKCADTKRLYWRHGVSLNNIQTDSKAFIEENIKKGIIDIIVVGDRARDYLAVILETYNDLHDSLGGLRPQILIPCNCITCKDNANPHYFQKEEQLEIRLKHSPPVETIGCDKPPFEKVNIRALISDVIDNRSERIMEEMLSLREEYSSEPFPKKKEKSDKISTKEERIKKKGDKKEGDTYISILQGAQIGSLTGKIDKQEIDNQSIGSTPPSVNEDKKEPVLEKIEEPKKWYDYHWIKSFGKGFIVSCIAGIIAFTVPLIYPFQITAITFLVVSFFSINQDPKYSRLWVVDFAECTEIQILPISNANHWWFFDAWFATTEY